jgi:hypothetical protein
VLARLSGWLGDWLYKRRLKACFEKLKYEQLYLVDFPRFYHVLKCEELAELNPDWKQVVLLFHMHHSTIGFDDHLVIHFMRWLQS